MSKQRAIFEEVGDKRPAETPKGGMIDAGRRVPTGMVRLWLALLFAMVAAMILVGGLTRLTDSGLSITEWKPITGALPPMSAADWEAEFELYRQIPQYELMNKGMTLDAFKSIYWWEWGHRQLGRAVGLVWALGFALLALTKRLPRGWAGRFTLLGALGGFQGFVGWWMVSSGLEGTMLSVASTRLAVHLSIAFLILGLITWFWLMLARDPRELLQARRSRNTKLWGMGTGLLHLAALQIILGALVAGIDAGRGFIDWPLMGGQVFPDSAFDLTPLWRNFIENAGLVQFLHRSAGYLLFIFGIVVFLRARRSARAAVRFGFSAVLAMLFLQMVLGIVTLMHASPLHLAILHQGGAILLWVLILRARFLAGYPPEQSVRD